MTDNTELENSSEETEQSTGTRDIVAQAMEAHETEKEQPAPEEVEQTETKEQPIEPTRDPWKSWNKEAAESMRGLPEDVQKHIIERENQFHKGLDQYREAANFAKNIDRAISPYKEYLGQLGVSPDVAFQNLLKTEKTLRTGSQAEKVEMFHKLAHDYGLPIEVLANTSYDPQQARLKSELAFYQDQLKASQDFRQSQEDAQLSQIIGEFGQQHEYFDDLREDMAQLLEAGIAKDLDDAYAKAVRLNQGVFEKMQAKQQANAQKQQLSAATQRAAQARSNAVQVKGAPTGVNNTPLPRTTEEAVRQAMLQLGY